MSDPPRTFSVEREIRIDASPETVFEFFVDPAKMTLWKGAVADLDARPGGMYRVEVIPGRAIALGEYVSIDRPRSVVFTWGWDGDELLPPGTSTVEVTLVPDGEATVVRLVHSGLPSEESVERHTDGWTHYLSRLQVAAAGGDPGRDPNLDAQDPR